MTPIGLVAPFELHGAKADFLQDMRQRTATAAAAPAIDERAIRFGLVDEPGVQMVRDVARNQCRAHLLGLER